ncbi:MAG: DUF1364 family protein [Methanococcoides sp.]|nr:DUF1364 family protein [Methanococcoides sp.]
MAASACQLMALVAIQPKGGQRKLFSQPKRKPYRNKKILAAARGEECLARTPYCNGDSSTVVAAHSDYYEDGKGKGQKADDHCVVFACSGCHDWFHHAPVSTSEKRDVWHRAMKRTWRRLLDMEVIK